MLQQPVNQSKLNTMKCTKLKTEHSTYERRFFNGEMVLEIGFIRYHNINSPLMVPSQQLNFGSLFSIKFILIYYVADKLNGRDTHQ